MLKKIRIKNFKSFKDETIIDLKASSIKFLADKNTYNDILKGAVFIGGNATGKTNALLAIRKILELLFADQDIELESDRCLFSSDKTMLLEYEFLIDGSVIEYIIEYDIYKEVLIEKLYLDKKEIINRVGKSAEANITEKTTYDDIASTSLILREIYFNTKFRGNETLRMWFNYMLNSVYLNIHLNHMFNPSKKNLKLREYLENNGTEIVNEFFMKRNFGQKIEYSKESSGEMLSIHRTKEKEIFFKRAGIGEPIPFSLESLGNKNLLRLLPIFFHSVNNGCMLLIDEFSSGFHNHLEQLLVRFFMEKSKNSQLFLVTHSTNLLSNSLLRPDQEFVVSFLRGKGSKINKVSSEKPRQAQNIEKMYLSGVFGGIPDYKGNENDLK